MSGKLRYSRADALAVARELCGEIELFCVPGFLKVCGSLRRRKESVGDVELVYIPEIEMVADTNDLFGSPGTAHEVNQVDALLEQLIQHGVLEKRLNKLGRVSWGAENKLARHCATGIPVDLFATSRPAWWSYVVCRTGSAESNTRIAAEALRKGWHWHPTAGYFSDVLRRKHWIKSEQDAFHLVGLPYLEPHQR